MIASAAFTVGSSMASNDAGLSASSSLPRSTSTSSSDMVLPNASRRRFRWLSKSGVGNAKSEPTHPKHSRANVTGIYNFISAIEAKRFGLLRETVPITGTIAVLLNSNYLGFDVQLNDLQEAARAVGQQIGVFNASSEADIHTAFRAVARLPAAALLVGADPFFNGRREQLVTAGGDDLHCQERLQFGLRVH
jgi:hypothetical protein